MIDYIVELLPTWQSLFLYTDEKSSLVFTSTAFWILFIAFIAVYALLYQRKTQMMVFVTAFSFFFYYKTSGVFFLLLVFTSLVDWIISQQLVKTENKTKRKLWLTLSLLGTLGILGYFKYANFVLFSWQSLMKDNFQPMDIILPAGISFYTFQSISYIIDVYRKKIEPTTSWLEYAFFLTFFPLLIAGPIMRAGDFLPQLKLTNRVSKEKIYMGLYFILVGVVKKAVVADYIGQYNNLVFDMPAAYSGFENLMGMLGYTIQIYCDFSGYSDIAIGITNIMGFQILKNFDFPYQSKNITEYWRRWHISLSSWLRDYVYISLGGNRNGKYRTYLNLFLTMLIGGIWHGAAWKYIIWGAMHGVGLVFHKMSKSWLDRFSDGGVIGFVSWLLTFSYVALLFVFFRCATTEKALIYLGNVFQNFDLNYFPVFVSARVLWCVMVLFMFALHFITPAMYARSISLFVRSPWVVKLALFIGVLCLVGHFAGENVQPFIYSRF